MNYGTTALALDCLASLREHFRSVTYEVVVVDNATPGFRPSQITDRFSEVRVLVNPSNVGFGRANNRASEVARGTYLWLLNPDVIVPAEHNLGAVLDFLERHPGHAAASPLLVDPTSVAQPGQRAPFPGLSRMLAEKPAKLLAQVAPATRTWFTQLSPDFADLVEGDVPVVVAASMFVRATAFREVGGFSPEYFMFLEDSDLCKKLAVSGFRIRFVPSAQVVHLWGRSLATERERKALYYRSQDVYLQKWSPPWVPTVARALRAPYRLRYSLPTYR